MKRDKKKDREEIIKKSHGLCAGGIAALIFFFTFGVYFDIFGKEFSDLPSFVLALFFLMFMLFLAYFFYMLDFITKNFQVLKQEEESKRKKKMKKQNN